MALGPYTEKTSLDLIYVGAVSGASGYKINDKTITVDFTEEVAISQVNATTFISIQPFQFARYDGELVLNPSSDFYTSEVLVPTTTNQTNDTQGLNNLVNAANQPNVLNSTILPTSDANDLQLSSLVPLNAGQFTGWLLSTTTGMNVPALADLTQESVWGVQNAEPAATVDVTRTVDGQRPISSLIDFFGVATDAQRAATSGDPTVIQNTLAADSATRTVSNLWKLYGSIA